LGRIGRKKGKREEKSLEAWRQRRLLLLLLTFAASKPAISTIGHRLSAVRPWGLGEEKRRRVAIPFPPLPLLAQGEGGKSHPLLLLFPID
jgi:hypothetical protein